MEQNPGVFIQIAGDSGFKIDDAIVISIILI